MPVFIPRNMTYLYQKFDFIAISRWFHSLENNVSVSVDRARNPKDFHGSRMALRPWGIRNGGIEELMRKGEDPGLIRNPTFTLDRMFTPVFL